MSICACRVKIKQLSACRRAHIKVNPPVVTIKLTSVDFSDQASSVSDMQQLLAWLYEYSTIRNIVFLVGVVYLLRLMIWLLLSLWSGTKAFFLDGLFRVDLKSYGWAG